MTKELTKAEAINILSAWISIELLTPQSFNKVKDLYPSQSVEVMILNKKLSAPWEGYNKAPKDVTIYYQIILGTIDLKTSISKLISKYGTDQEEQYSTQGEAAVAFITVDQYGRMLKDQTSYSVSSFPWGINNALQGDMSSSSSWSKIERLTKDNLYKILVKLDGNDKPLPLEVNSIFSAQEYLLDEFSISDEVCIKHVYVVKRTYNFKQASPPEPIGLNSFYLNDLISAKHLIENNKATSNLKRYLGMIIPKEKYNILEDNHLLKDILSPKKIPLARWPSYGRHPLVTLQQAAVNLSMNELNEGGILGINGPPGTGKTTLLRDTIASVVLQKAKILSSFDNPADAFIKTNDKIIVKKSTLQLYKISEQLRSLGIIIASSNNKAVENISIELPNSNSIASDISELRYFKTVSDNVVGSDTWGIISATLGNANNRYKFFKLFWDDVNCGLSTYLAHASGQPQVIEKENLKTKEIIKIIPKIILSEDPPINNEDALRRWRIARKHFQIILHKVENRFLKLEKISKLIDELANLNKQLNNGETLEEKICRHNSQKPMLLYEIFNTKSYKLWTKEYKKLIAWKEIKHLVNEYTKEYATHVIDDKFFLQDYKEIHLAAPWCDNETKMLRDELFIESIKLHKAFIDVAAVPLRHNLGAMMQFLSGSIKYLNDLDINKILSYSSELWDTLFLVVPCLSTTFASIGSMLKHLPQNSVGWLIVDEAGQALPQAAIGAIIRSKRIIVTGDPLQIEPIVTLPSKLTYSIFSQLMVNDPRQFNAPEASVQTLADSASPYFAEFHTKIGSRYVGLPLVVHRRCANPMFNISNSIAYEKLMVKARAEKKSSIKDILGESMWFDIEGSAYNKWSPEEGKKVIELLIKLKNNNVHPDIYIITPFLEVANKIKELINKSNILEKWVNDKNIWLQERIGTVHTVQGKESECVILVLGAPLLDQNGSRIWAGRTPNLLNVAVTRAKEVIYVIGNKKLWKSAGVFEKLYSELEA